MEVRIISVRGRERGNSSLVVGRKDAYVLSTDTSSQITTSLHRLINAFWSTSPGLHYHKQISDSSRLS